MGGRNNAEYSILKGRDCHADPIYSVHTMPNTLHVIERLASGYLHKSNYVHDISN